MTRRTTPWERRPIASTAGFVYYLTNTLLFEGDYEWLHNRGPNPDGLPSSQFVIQLSYGF